MNLTPPPPASPRHTLFRLGTTILDWSFEAGWDRDYGGILYYRDARGLPCTEYWHDMKLWWLHNEAIIACLLAWQLMGDPKYARWHEQTQCATASPGSM